jgi:hypothetical protein
MTPELKPVAVGSSPTNPQRDVARVASVLAVIRAQPEADSAKFISTDRLRISGGEQTLMPHQTGKHSVQ